VLRSSLNDPFRLFFSSPPHPQNENRTLFSLHGGSQRILKASSTFLLLYYAQDCIGLCRDIVIDLLRGSGPKAKLKKAEILEHT